MHRIAVVGKTGSGKTTMARTLAARLDLIHIELDSLYWGTGWSPRPPEEFRVGVEDAIRAPAWTTDGNYRLVRDLIWGKADTLVWLDYPLPVALWRITLRTIGRLQRREVLWDRNVEPWGSLFGRDSLLLYAVRTHRHHRQEFPAFLLQPQYQHLHMIRLTHPQAAQDWLNTVAP